MNDDDFERGRLAWYEKMRGLDDDGDEQDDDDDELDEEESHLCDACNGSGEGLYSMKCFECNGSGVL